MRQQTRSGEPRSIGRDGAGASWMTSHLVQHSFGRTCRMTLKLAGTYSSISDTSSPSLLSPPPHAVHVSRSGICTCTSRGRCSGSGCRDGRCLGGSLPGPASARSALRTSSSSSFNSSCSISLVIFSLLVPNIMRRNFAMMSLRCSISLSRLSSFSCCARTSAASVSRSRERRSAATEGLSCIAGSMP
jgi:hypothetical protein